MSNSKRPPFQGLDTDVAFTGLIFACPFDQKSHPSCILCGLREAPIRARMDATKKLSPFTKEQIVKHHAACLRRLLAEGKHLDVPPELAAKVAELTSSATDSNDGIRGAAGTLRHDELNQVTRATGARCEPGSRALP